MEIKNIKLETLACPACATKIQTVLSKQKGVSKAEVFYNASKVKIEYNEKIITLEELKNTIKSLGYEVK